MAERPALNTKDLWLIQDTCENWNDEGAIQLDYLFSAKFRFSLLGILPAG
jgi:hypothetical protein